MENAREKQIFRIFAKSIWHHNGVSMINPNNNLKHKGI